MMRRGVDAPLNPLSGYTRFERRPAERTHARDVGRERQRLQVEHQFDVLGERVGTPTGASGRAAISRSRSSPHALMRRSISRLRRGTQRGASASAAPSFLFSRVVAVAEPVEDAAVFRAPLGALLRCGATPNNWSKTVRGSRVIGSGCVAEAQLIRIGIRARIAVRAPAAWIDVLDTQLDGRNRSFLAERLRINLVQRRPA